MMIHKRILIYSLLFVATILVLNTSTGAATAKLTLTPKEQLGKSIFFDKNLSINRNQSCAACHAAEVGWTGPDAAINAHGSVYEGSISSRFGDRKPPSSGYATFSPILHIEVEQGETLFVGGNFWDGRATGEKLGNPAADQAQGPFGNPVEQALPDSACVVYRVCNPAVATDYPIRFERVWGADACSIAWPANVEAACSQEGTTVALSAQDRAKSHTAFDQIALSIAAYEGSPDVNAFSSKFDFAVEKRAKLTQEEKRGFKLFTGKAQCANCHTLDRKGRNLSLFTDFTYDNIGVPKNPENPVYAANPSFVDLGLGGFLARRADYASYAAENEGKQKVPTLRNVDKRPSPDFVKTYMHNGYFKTLEGVVHFYNTRDALPRCPGDFSEAQALAAGCWPAPEVTANLNRAEVGNLGLNQDEEAAIVAFMKTLSDGYRIYGGGKSADTEDIFDEGTEGATKELTLPYQIFLPVISSQ